VTLPLDQKDIVALKVPCLWTRRIKSTSGDPVPGPGLYKKPPKDPVPGPGG